MFYISSRGHSATGWLSKTLMRQGGVVCFHGSRSIGAYDSGAVPDTPIDQYIEMLAQMERNTGLVFGSCHGYYGAASLSPVRLNGGTFLAILREPVKRTQSIYSNSIASLMPLAQSCGLNIADVQLDSSFSAPIHSEVSSTINRLSKQFKLSTFGNLGKIAARFDRKLTRVTHSGGPEKQLGRAIGSLLFTSIIASVVLDQSVILACDREDLILMERMTTDEVYFRDRVWNRILPSITNPAPSLTGLARINEHSPSSQRKMSAEAVYLSWNELFRDAMADVLGCQPVAQATYREVGYFVP